MTVSIERYFQLVRGDFPLPNGPLSSTIPTNMIATANRKIRNAQDIRAQRKSKQGSYLKYSLKERAEIGSYSVMCSIPVTRRKSLRKLSINISCSAIQSIKVAYEEEML